MLSQGDASILNDTGRVISNASAMKTGYQTRTSFMDYQAKATAIQNLEKEQAEARAKSSRVRTKGKFADSSVRNPGEHYERDINWMQRANPQAAEFEKKYLERDLQLLAKRKQQKVLQTADLEEQMQQLCRKIKKSKF